MSACRSCATDRRPIWDGSSTIACVAKGFRGCVTNAAVRDTAQIRTLRFPVFAAGVNLRGAVKSHPGWTQIPISIGEVQVNPGDLVFADERGGVIVRPERAREGAARAVERLSSLGR